MLEAAPSAQRLAPAPLRHGLAVVSVAAAVLVGGLLGRLFGIGPLERFADTLPFLYAAVMISAWLGGMGPGWLAVVLATLAIDYFLVAPLYGFTLEMTYVPRVAGFALSALLVGWLSVKRRRVEDALRRSRDELEVRVRERTADLTRRNEQLHAEVTERKRAEEAVRRQANLLEQTHDAIFVWEFPRTIVYWNRGAEELYGFSRAEAIGRFGHELLQTEHPMPTPVFEATLERDGQWTGELTHTTRDGRRIILESRHVLMREADGRRLVLETNRDITERKQAEGALQKAQAELAHITRVTTMAEMAASIAHEINQPLAAVVSNGGACLRWLSAAPPNLAEAREAATRIVRDGHRASDVLARIRALLKKSAPEKTRLEVNAVIADVIALAHPEVVWHRVSLRTSLAEGLAPVLGDRIQLQQVLLNLIMNGIEAMSAVTGRPRELVIETERGESGGVLVTVQDSGIGLDPQTTDRLFDAFFTTKPAGLGMGLSISRSIVEAHGGRLWASPNTGPGATFRFTLPPVGEGAA